MPHAALHPTASESPNFPFGVVRRTSRIDFRRAQVILLMSSIIAAIQYIVSKIILGNHEFMAHDPWENLLATNEEILWQGAPKSQVRLEWESPFVPFFFLFFTGFSVFWMVSASKAGGLFWTFGLLFLFIGMYGLVGVHFWKAFVRRRQHYTLTNQRAMIGTDMFGRKKLQSYPITKTTDIDFEETGSTGNIYFAKRENPGENGTTVTRIGFEQIKNSRQVLSIMRQVQEAR